MKENGKKTTKVASKKTTKVASKKGQTASKKAEKASRDFYFMNVKYEGIESVIKIGESRDVRIKYVDEDTFVVKEKAKRAAGGLSQKQTTLDRTAHGKVSVDDYGVYVHFYFPFTEFSKKAKLAEALESEAEMMGDRIMEKEEFTI